MDRFLKAWQYPEVSLDEEVDLDEDYTIVNAPDPKFRKLDYFVFKDEKIETQQVATMYYHVVKALFAENPSLFSHDDIKSAIGLASDPSQLREPYPISSTYYVESNIDNVSKFRRLRILLERFGYEDELLINFSNEDVDDRTAAVDRQYWVRKALPSVLSMVDDCVQMLLTIDPSVQAHYRRRYIGYGRPDSGTNLIRFFPNKDNVRVSLTVRDTEYWIAEIGRAGLESLGVHKGNGRLRFRLERMAAGQRSFMEAIFRAAIVEVG